MKCDLCNNKANVYLTQIVEGKMQKVNLCESCAREKGVTDPTGFALADLLFGIGQQQDIGPAGDRADACPQCGMTGEDLKKAGRVGCARCYEVFSDGLDSLLKAMHKGTRHKGKVPHHQFEQRSRVVRLREMREKLDAAVRDERFEDAARFRDEIHALESPPTTEEIPRAEALRPGKEDR